MKMIRTILLSVMVLCGVGSAAADEELITEQITINVDKPGTLPNMIGESKRNIVTNLKLTGKLNGSDIELIREMAGGSPDDGKSKGKLSTLDLSEAVIVEGGTYFYYDENMRKSAGVYSWNNVVGAYMFYGCKSLEKIYLPETAVEIREYAFAGCPALNEVVFGNNLKSIGKKTFSGCVSLSSVVLTKNLENIGDCAFEECGRLTAIRSNVNRPPLLGNTVFLGCDRKSCRLTVPHETRGAYWLSAWGDFFMDIKEMGEVKK